MEPLLTTKPLEPEANPMGDAIPLSELIRWQLNGSGSTVDDDPPILKCPAWTL